MGLYSLSSLCKVVFTVNKKCRRLGKYLKNTYVDQSFHWKKTAQFRCEKQDKICHFGNCSKFQNLKQLILLVANGMKTGTLHLRAFTILKSAMSDLFYISCQQQNRHDFLTMISCWISSLFFYESNGKCFRGMYKIETESLKRLVTNCPQDCMNDWVGRD